jgi:hypothetical protein
MSTRDNQDLVARSRTHFAVKPFKVIAQGDPHTFAGRTIVRSRGSAARFAVSFVLLKCFKGSQLWMNACLGCRRNLRTHSVTAPY